tara:strand:- start:457 stop:624 length:168 start_codon:yes stop_codon:yes gene_type:complete
MKIWIVYNTDWDQEMVDKVYLSRSDAEKRKAHLEGKGIDCYIDTLIAEGNPETKS